MLIAICFKQLGWNFSENKIDIEFYRLHRNFQKSERVRVRETETQKEKEKILNEIKIFTIFK